MLKPMEIDGWIDPGRMNTRTAEVKAIVDAFFVETPTEDIGERWLHLEVEVVTNEETGEDEWVTDPELIGTTFSTVLDKYYPTYSARKVVDDYGLHVLIRTKREVSPPKEGSKKRGRKPKLASVPADVA